MLRARCFFVMASLERHGSIAGEAGVTRGAIYWHFKDKVALFFAMREQTILPLVHRVGDVPLR